MREKKLDCRGLACPQPVLKVKELIDDGTVTQVTVLVDNPAARENVGRFLARVGYSVTSCELDGSYEITGSREEKPEGCEIESEDAAVDRECKIAVLVGTDCMGRGDDDLGRKLLFNFIGTLKEMGPELWRLILLNGGVKLTVESSDSLGALRDLENGGIHILVCGTCLGHFGLLEKKQVGETTNMLDIVTALQLADKTISIM